MIFYWYGFWLVYIVLAFIVDTASENGWIRVIKMGKLIDADELKNSMTIGDIHSSEAYENMNEIKKWIDGRPPVEAIPKAEYENRLKADMDTMLNDLLSEIEELPMHYDPSDVSALIWQKINALYEEDKTEYKDILKKSLLNDCESCEAHYKDLMMDMLEEIKDEANKLEDPKYILETSELPLDVDGTTLPLKTYALQCYCRGWEDVTDIIDKKINTLKEEKISRKEL